MKIFALTQTLSKMWMKSSRNSLDPTTTTITRQESKCHLKVHNPEIYEILKSPLFEWSELQKCSFLSRLPLEPSSLRYITEFEMSDPFLYSVINNDKAKESSGRELQFSVIKVSIQKSVSKLSMWIYSLDGNWLKLKKYFYRLKVKASCYIKSEKWLVW